MRDLGACIREPLSERENVRSIAASFYTEGQG